MTRDEVIAFAHESDEYLDSGNQPVYAFSFEELQRAFEAVAAHEREACKLACQAVIDAFGGIAEGKFVTDFGKHTHQSMAAGATHCLAAIADRATKEQSHDI